MAWQEIFSRDKDEIFVDGSNTLLVKTGSIQQEDVTILNLYALMHNFKRYKSKVVRTQRRVGQVYKCSGIVLLF